MEQTDPGTGEVVASIPPAIAAAIVAVMGKVRQLGSDEKNEHAKYNYVSVDKFYERIGPLMSEAGLALLIDEEASDIRVSEKSSNQWLFVRFALTFIHSSGAVGPALRRSCALPISGPQAFGAAQSYIEKQFLRQVFKVPTGDKDADDTAPSDSAPQGGGRSVNAIASRTAATYRRQEAAPPPSDTAQEATRMYRLVRDEIDATNTIPELEQIERGDLWDRMQLAVRAAQPKDIADQAIVGLVNRIAKRTDMLMEDAR